MLIAEIYTSIIYDAITIKRDANGSFTSQIILPNENYLLRP